MEEELQQGKGSRWKAALKRWNEQWSFTTFERRALLFVSALVIIASLYRLYRTREREVLITSLPIAADSSIALLGAHENPVLTVDINSASERELQSLPGIGAVKAARIIEVRDRLGGFHSIDELDSVEGIGPRLLDKLRPLVTLETADADIKIIKK